ncbi:MAG TPA: right-handed parallel beta-helix repeat-containing protein [Candidatus Binataceae bacterium]|nr:right-handed parallel beta-helix repeat-containing protein [Candidatus Binataceae bacterium]
MAQKYGRGGRMVICFVFALALAGIGHGSAQAQTKLVKPLNGGTIKILKSGSYFLAANIVSLLVGNSVISVNANNVTINLNGFTISGPGGAGTAIAINALGDSGVTIVNGVITRIPGAGIVLGSNSIVSGVQIVNNNGDGIDCGTNCLIAGDIVTGNNGVGLNFTDGSSGYQNDILGNTTNVIKGTNLGHNVCGTALCP